MRSDGTVLKPISLVILISLLHLLASGHLAADQFTKKEARQYLSEVNRYYSANGRKVMPKQCHILRRNEGVYFGLDMVAIRDYTGLMSACRRLELLDSFPAKAPKKFATEIDVKSLHLYYLGWPGLEKSSIEKFPSCKTPIEFNSGGPSNKLPSAVCGFKTALIVDGQAWSAVEVYDHAYRDVDDDGVLDLVVFSYLDGQLLGSGPPNRYVTFLASRVPGVIEVLGMDNGFEWQQQRYDKMILRQILERNMKRKASINY